MAASQPRGGRRRFTRLPESFLEAASWEAAGREEGRCPHWTVPDRSLSSQLRWTLLAPTSHSAWGRPRLPARCPCDSLCRYRVAPWPLREVTPATPAQETGLHGRRRTGLTRAGSASTQLPACRAGGGRCQVGIRGPVRKQHEGFRRRKRGSAPQLRNPPHCHVRQRIARGARTSWPIRSRRTRVPEGSSHSRPGEGV